MDFSKLDLREAAGRQDWVHLRVGDTLLFADEDKQERPCRVKAASVTEPGVEGALKAMERAGRKSESLEAQLITANREQKKEVERQADEAARASEKAISAFLRLVIVGWENIEVSGKEVEFNADALHDLTEPKAPLFRLAPTISKDLAALYNPFSKAEGA